MFVAHILFCCGFGENVTCPISSQAAMNPETPTHSSSATMDQVQGQVNEVKVILKDNINKVLERGDRLDDLIGKTDDLQTSVCI